MLWILIKLLIMPLVMGIGYEFIKYAGKHDNLRVIIALPAPRTCTSIKDENGLSAEAISAFTKTTVSVEGANGYTAKDYNVYYKDNAAANNKANNWIVTVG